MLTLEENSLVFRFPNIDEKSSLIIDFQRTLRIPDTDKIYPLPPGLGRFPIRHTEDFESSLPAAIAERGGVILPMWQTEAMWMNFTNNGPKSGLNFPVAIKVASGKINAVTGDPWRPDLQCDPQDYMVSPNQPWLDGFAVEKGIVRQFVAMPLSDGYTVEEQLSSEAKWGGIQISVTPLKLGVWERIVAEHIDIIFEDRAEFSNLGSREMSAMGIAAGGKMKQEIFTDTLNFDDWDQESTERVFVSILNAEDWNKIIPDTTLTVPPNSEDYQAAGLPWFDFYSKDQKSIIGSKNLSEIKSLAKIYTEKTGLSLPYSGDFDISQTIKLDTNRDNRREIKDAPNWDKS